MESAFEKYDWVIDTISWYAWGEQENPSYKKVSSWLTKHRESVKVLYNPSKITYKDLLEVFWRNINPTDSKWQYNDRGFQYTTAIFYTDSEEKGISINSKEELEKTWRYDKKIITPILEFKNFYPAENYHQNFYKKNPLRYNTYTSLSWRKKYLKKIWWDDLYYEIESKSNLKSRLTPLQYHVTQENWTERAFDNEYRNNKKQGIYVDIIDWTPLFSSLHKYDSKTWWPSFTKPLNKKDIDEIDDYSLIFKRTEIRSKKANSHLGHLFNDWPKDEWWLRYCINSASLKFIPKENLEKEGYREYLEMFEA